MKYVDIDDYKGISMAEFLLNYADLDGNLLFEQVLEMEKDRLSHQDITKLGIPYIKRVPNNIVTEEDLLSGDIIIVYDFTSTKNNKKRAPYKRPMLVKQAEEAKKQKNGERNKRILGRRIKNG